MTDGPRENFDQPSAARLYDYFLGGTHNYSTDRNFAAEAMEILPHLPDIARQNRGFLGRAVRYMARHGIKQFLDIGSGIPTSDNVHQIAHRIDPEIRVVYVDNDNEAIVTSRQMLHGNRHATAIYGDLRAPDAIFDDPVVQHMINPDEPTGLLAVAVFHFISEREEPDALAQRYRDRLAPGSYFAATHVTADDVTPSVREKMEELERRYGSTANPATIRTKDQFAKLFDGYEIVDPGIVYGADWQATEPVDPNNPARPSMWAAVGRKP